MGGSECLKRYVLLVLRIHIHHDTSLYERTRALVHWSQTESRDSVPSLLLLGHLMLRTPERKLSLHRIGVCPQSRDVGLIVQVQEHVRAQYTRQRRGEHDGDLEHIQVAPDPDGQVCDVGDEHPA
jgi:hypothetical protein